MEPLYFRHILSTVKTEVIHTSEENNGNIGMFPLERALYFSQSGFEEMLHCIYVCTHRLEHPNQQKYLWLGYITNMYSCDIQRCR